MLFYIQDGDIVNVDVTVYHRGYHGDLNESFFVGKPKEAAKKLVINTWECLEKAMEMVKPGVKFRDVGNVIQKHAQSEGFSVVRSYCGHGEYYISGRDSLDNISNHDTPFENAQRWMGKNTFPILLLNDDNMIGEH